MSATLHINKQNEAAGKTTNHENKDVKGQRKSPSTGMSWWSYAHFETTNVPKEASVWSQLESTAWHKSFRFQSSTGMEP